MPRKASRTIGCGATSMKGAAHMNLGLINVSAARRLVATHRLAARHLATRRVAARRLAALVPACTQQPVRHCGRTRRRRRRRRRSHRRSHAFGSRGGDAAGAAAGGTAGDATLPSQQLRG